jgi:hypothetical protein
MLCGIKGSGYDVWEGRECVVLGIVCASTVIFADYAGIS